jgi:hypothetical protein
MTVRELNIGDVFQVVGEPGLWRKVSGNEARSLDSNSVALRAPGRVFAKPEVAGCAAFNGKEIEVVERAGEICRAENTLILRGGEVRLEYIGAWEIHSHTPGDPFTQFVLAGHCFSDSRAEAPTDETALAFSVRIGAKQFGRPRGTEVFAYRGRVYARATNREFLGKAKPGGYYLLRSIDGRRRLVIAGMLTIPGEFALHDIIMEHFGPDTVKPSEPGSV